MPQHEQEPAFVVERVEDSVEGRHREPCAFRCGVVVHEVWKLAILRQSKPALDAARTQHAARNAHGDPDQEGAQRARLTQACESPKKADEHLLQRVFDLGTRAECAPQHLSLIHISEPTRPY